MEKHQWCASIDPKIHIEADQPPIIRNAHVEAGDSTEPGSHRFFCNCGGQALCSGGRLMPLAGDISHVYPAFSDYLLRCAKRSPSFPVRQDRKIDTPCTLEEFEALDDHTV